MRTDPTWFDVVRPTKLPAFDNELGADGRWFSGVRQSRLGVRTSTPTRRGDLTTIFEFELFGVGVDAGQTTFRLRHAYGELGHFGAGQTWSPFMDIDVFPNSLEYWGSSGMTFFRNVQVRWMPIQGDTRMTIAVERPGASGDLGDYSAEIEAQGVQARYPPQRRRPAAGSLRRGNRELHERRDGGHQCQADRERQRTLRWRGATDIDNSSGQSADAFHRGHYALGNLLYYPVPRVMMGAEFQWARRENNSDGFTSEDARIQFSAKYNLAYHEGGRK